MDWKDALASLSGLPEGDDSPTMQPENQTTGQADHQTPKQKSALHVLIEKKGRGGKTATIIEGFEITDEEIDEIARTLRKKLGTGGSARGGEILIQGDRKNDVINHLKGMGFKVKG
ncbi:MAG: translation initiation factor [Muribaculaceae bacterium]|nr:translation initiation factor [Muribaculaceae bacterium]